MGWRTCGSAWRAWWRTRRAARPAARRRAARRSRRAGGSPPGHLATAGTGAPGAAARPRRPPSAAPRPAWRAAAACRRGQRRAQPASLRAQLCRTPVALFLTRMSRARAAHVLRHHLGRRRLHRGLDAGHRRQDAEHGARAPPRALRPPRLRQSPSPALRARMPQAAHACAARRAPLPDVRGNDDAPHVHQHAARQPQGGSGQGTQRSAQRTHRSVLLLRHF